MTEHETLYYDFDRFRVDPAERLLLCDDQPVALTPKAFETLLALVERSGRVVSKEELLAAVWPETYVEEATLTQNVYTLRKALAAAGAGRRVIETVPRRGYRFTGRVRQVGDPAAPPRPPAGSPLRGARTLAVLPFHALGAGEEASLVGVGMADALITQLSNLRRLTVRPTSAVLRFTGTDRDPVKIGRRLGVEAVLEGTIQALGERRRVSVQLLDVRDGAPFWAERFDAAVTDPFALQDSISEQAVRALRLELTDPERSRLLGRHTEHPAAYDAYVRGRYFWNKRTGEDLERALAYFQRAVELDPLYARAHAGLADCHVVLPLYGSSTPEQVFPHGIKAARRALELDDSLAEAHTSLAYAHCFYEWDWTAAETAFRRALELNPGYANAHHWYGFFLSALDRRQEALAHGQRAQELDPLSLVITTDLGFVHYFARRFEEAVAQHRRALELDPEFPYARFALSLAYLELGRHEEAVVEARRAVELTAGANTAMQAALGHALARSGQEREARRILKELAAQSRREPVPASRPALIHAALGETDAALACLARACDERSRFILFLAVWPVFDPLRPEPAFQALLQRVGLSRVAAAR